MNPPTSATTHRRWDPCVSHRGGEVDAFLCDYFPDRKALFVAGAGFDPRAQAIAARLRNAGASVTALLIKEKRPNAPDEQSTLAQTNTNELLRLLGEQTVLSIDIFDRDGAVVGGRNVVKALGQQSIACVTDVIVDVSALSVGTSYPVVRYFFELATNGQGPPNLHLFVTHNPSIDSGIRSVSGDSPGYIHGFRGDSTLSHAADATRLWLPQLSSDRRQALEKVV